MTFMAHKRHLLLKQIKYLETLDNVKPLELKSTCMIGALGAQGKFEEVVEFS